MPRKSALFLMCSLWTVHAFGQSIVVTAPAAGVTWRVGETHMITWTKTGTMDDAVKIRLVQAGAIVLEIAENVPNSGSFSWTIPATVLPGTSVVRVRTMNNAVMDNSDAFGIAAAAASSGASHGPVAVVSPNGKEVIPINRPFRITWQASSGGAEGRTVDLLLCRDGRPIGVVAENVPIMQRMFDWNVARLLAGSAELGPGYTIRIRVDGTTIQDESDREFVLDPGPAAGGGGTGGDLVLVALENSGNKVAARIRSTFPRFAGTVMYEMRRPVGAPTPVFRSPLTMLFEEPGEKTYVMENIIPSRPTDADFCASTYEMFLDITNLVEETNELTNHQTARLYGNPTFAVVEYVWWGGQGTFRGGTLGVSSGEIVRWGNGSVRSVNQVLYVQLRNCGYSNIRRGELRVSQIGVLRGDRPGMSPTYRTKELLHDPQALPAMGREIRPQTLEIAFSPDPSEIRVEYIWEDDGLHTNMAVYSFYIDFRGYL